MKTNHKRLIGILVVLAMVLAMLPMAVSAADTVTLYCDAPDAWEVCNVYWWGSAGTNPSWPGVAMTKGANGIWSYDVPADATNVIFNNGSAQSADLAMPTDNNVQYNYEAKAWGTYGSVAEPVETVYYLRGSMNGWDTSAPMTKQADGTYAITMTLEAGTYEYKAGTDDWGFGCPSANATLTLENTTNVTFVLDVEAYTLTATGAGVEPPVVDNNYYLRGDMNDWDTSTVMNDNGDGTWSVTVNLEPGTYEYKAGKADWSASVPAEANATVTVTTACAVTFVANTNDGTITATGSGVDAGEPEPPVEPDPIVVSSVNAVGSAGLFGVEWDPTANKMSGRRGVYTITLSNIAAGSYEYKFAANGAWGISWGAGCETVSGETYDAYLNGSNSTLVVEKDGSTVKLTLDLSAMDDITGEGAKCMAEVTAPAEPEPPTEPSTQPTEPSSEPTEPSDEPTEPSSEPTEPSDEPTEPSDEPTEPSDEPTEPSDEPTEPSDEPTEPSDEPTEPSDEPTEPSDEPTEPSDEPTEPSDEPTEPSDEPTEPSDEPTEPSEPENPEDDSIPCYVKLWIKWWKFYIRMVKKYLAFWFGC